MSDDKNPLEWTFSVDEGRWRAFSVVKDATGFQCRWVIRMLEDGRFDINASSPDLYTNRGPYDTLATAKGFCESVEATQRVLL